MFGKVTPEPLDAHDQSNVDLIDAENLISADAGVNAQIEAGLASGASNRSFASGRMTSSRFMPKNCDSAIFHTKALENHLKDKVKSFKKGMTV